MKRTSDHQPIFTVNKSGSLDQTGSTSLFSIEDSAPHNKTRDRALALKSLLEANGLSIGKSPTLAKLFNHTMQRSKARNSGTLESIPDEHVQSAAQMERIASAVEVLPTDLDPRPYLVALLDGSINLLDRERSKAKDTLWEIELLRMLRNVGINVQLGEPDLIVEFEGAKIGIACKKLYSEANVAKVLSEAISQVEREFEFGIIAVNLDDLLPKTWLPPNATTKSMLSILEGRLFTFMKEHERHLKRYLEPGRAMTALMSCGALADLPSAQPRFLNARQSVAWHIPGLPSAKDQQMANFIDAFRSHYEA